MAGTGEGATKSSSSNASRSRKRVQVDSSSTSASLKRAEDGSAFTRCQSCNKHVAIALISLHDCFIEAKIDKTLVQELESSKEAAIATSKSKEKTSEPKAEPKAKRLRKAKDPNRLKRPPTAFFLFMDDFRKTFKEANPDNKSVAVVAKEGGEKWKSMTDEDKKPYADKAAELKEEHAKALKSDSAKDEEASPEKEEKVEEVQDILDDDE